MKSSNTFALNGSPYSRRIEYIRVVLVSHRLLRRQMILGVEKPTQPGTTRRSPALVGPSNADQFDAQKRGGAPLRVADCTLIGRLPVVNASDVASKP
jgi:hypothetical protein